MNKNDCKLIIILLITFVAGILLFQSLKKAGKSAKVYYENNLILNVDLSINHKYEVAGYNGNVKIEVKDGKIRVIEENSPYHICSKQGFISSSFETIICLPNKIIIKIEDDNHLDGVVK